MIVVRSFTAADVELGMRLKAAANWNQTEADWRRLLELEPAGCFVGLCDDVPAATLTFTCFGDIAWVAMVLTDPAFRGRGLATALLERALADLNAHGVTAVRLDATSLGRPVYERLGFRVVGEETRFYGVPTVPSAAAFEPLSAENLPAAATLDRAATGNDRTRLLSSVFIDWPDASLAMRSEGELKGFALARRGSRAPQLGPCIVAPGSDGAPLLTSALGRFADTAVYVDVPSLNGRAMALVAGCGLAVERTFFRMTRGRDVVDSETDVWANYGPELG